MPGDSEWENIQQTSSPSELGSHRSFISTGDRLNDLAVILKHQIIRVSNLWVELKFQG